MWPILFLRTNDRSPSGIPSNPNGLSSCKLPSCSLAVSRPYEYLPGKAKQESRSSDPKAMLKLSIST